MADILVNRFLEGLTFDTDKGVPKPAAFKKNEAKSMAD
jgi:hypothetical protein